MSNDPVSIVSIAHKDANEGQVNPNPQQHEKLNGEGPKPGAATEGVKATAKAFVSYCSSDTMLVARVLIAGELQEAHLDSCASHCFISSAMSQHLTSIGYPPVTSPVCFEVKQGNPLCDTNSVHFAPLSIVLESGAVCTWDSCLFLVADAGAPIILCYSLLRLGGILSYEPPQGYERLLERAALAATTNPPRSMARPGTQAQHFATMREGTYYHAPSTTTPPVAPHQWAAKCMATEVENNPCIEHASEKTETQFPFHKISFEDNVHENAESETRNRPSERGTTTPIMHPNITPFLHQNFEQHPEMSASSGKISSDFFDSQRNLVSEVTQVGRTAIALNTSLSTTPHPTKKRKGDTDMLTPENPYGKNPPLPEAVMEALKHLKLLSNPNTAPSYTPLQIEEIRKRFQEDRPGWANCLTLDQTLDVSDKETEMFLYDLMDKPRYQTSIFSSNLSKC